MALNVWKGACAFLLVIVFLQFYLIASDTRIPRVPGFTHPASADSSSASPDANERLTPPSWAPSKDFTEKWTYDPKRDHQNIGLTTAQCDAAFPDLYYEIDRSVDLWRERKHTISPQDVEIDWRRDAAMQLLIYDNQLRIIRTKATWQQQGYKRRALYVLAQLNRALLGVVAAGERVPNIEFSVVVDDMALLPNGNDTHSPWTFTRRLGDENQKRIWIIPDFNFYASPPRASSWIEQQRLAKTHDGYLMDKIPKAVWRGAKWTNAEIRGRLLDIAKDKPWADIEEVNWNVADNIMTMDDMCRYMFTVHTEGRSWSGRLKFLLNCDSVAIVHRLEWTAQFYHLLKATGPDQNYIRVSRDFDNLEEMMDIYLNDPKAAQRIADNAAKTFRYRYTSPAAESCYWRRLIHSYSEVAFTPEPFELARRNRSGEEIEDTRLRGITYEEMLLFDGEGNYPPPGE